jgi:hypothetical protein
MFEILILVIIQWSLVLLAVSVASFFIVAEKTIMACARKHSLLLEESLKQEK